MQENKFRTPKAATIIFIAYLSIVTLFFIYEITLIGNPFRDPIAPNILWGLLTLISWGFGFRYFSALRKK